MVNHNHKRIKAQGEGEVGDEIDWESFEREQDSRWDWTKWRNSRVGVDLVLLANCTTGYEMFDKGGETQPLEILFKDRFGVEDTHVDATS